MVKGRGNLQWRLMQLKSQGPSVHGSCKALEERKPCILMFIYFCNICKSKMFLHFLKKEMPVFHKLQAPWNLGPHLFKVLTLSQ